MSFFNSSHTTITGENTLNHVQGNQVTGTINARIVNFNPSQAVVKRTVCDEFQYVRRGDMITLKQLGSRDLSEWNWNCRNGRMCGRLKAKTKLCTVEVYPDRQSKFTAIVYEGEDARTLWEEDFQQFSRTDDLQLFGINHSEIPALIFHHELIPCAHLYTGSFWMNVYIIHLAENMGCLDYMVWMNTTSGMLLRGPEGPFTNFRSSRVDESIVVPSTVDMLNDDTSFRFFSKLGSRVDNDVLNCALNSFKYRLLDNLFRWTAEDHQSKDADHLDSHRYWIRDLWHNPPDHLPMDVIGGLRFDTVYSPSLEAVARRPPEAGSLWSTDGLVDVTEMDGGLTRLMLDWVQRERVNVTYDWTRFWKEWLSQCSHVFDVLGVTEEMQDFFVVQPPFLSLEFTPRFSTHNAEHETPPIYLFLHPLPMTISELASWIEGIPYFWSFDETGQSQMSEEECKRWRLPVLTISTESKITLFSWPIHIYTALRDWQKARGFDPTTSDWAQSMGYPELEINGTEDHFVVVEDTPDKGWGFLWMHDEARWTVLFLTIIYIITRSL